MQVDRVIIGSDHAGYELKQKVKTALSGMNIEIRDVGTASEESCDYPDFAHPLADAITGGEFEMGILICGSGNGISMAANKHNGIRAAICWNSELAQLAREHNNANVLSLPARFVDDETAMDCVRTFFSTDFEGGRHERRVNKIDL